MVTDIAVQQAQTIREYIHRVRPARCLTQTSLNRKQLEESEGRNYQLKRECVVLSCIYEAHGTQTCPHSPSQRRVGGCSARCSPYQRRSFSSDQRRGLESPSGAAATTRARKARAQRAEGGQRSGWLAARAGTRAHRGCAGSSFPSKDYGRPAHSFIAPRRALDKRRRDSKKRLLMALRAIRSEQRLWPIDRISIRTCSAWPRRRACPFTSLAPELTCSQLEDAMTRVRCAGSQIKKS